MVFPVLFAVCLWAAGVDLKSGRPELHVPFAAIFLAPFAAAAWLVIRGRRVRGVHVVDLDAETGRLELHFDDPVIAARIAERNAAPPVAATPAGDERQRGSDDGPAPP
jgi:hypothetical protein